MQTISPRSPKSPNWSTIIMFALGFWLSGSLVFDFLVVPGMLTTGMMNEPGFASAGYVIFGTFNHLELLCAAIILAGCLVYRFGDLFNQQVSYKSVLTAATLLAIALVYTYFFTPQMSSAGMSLDLFATTTEKTSTTMTVMHLGYWSLEVTKLFCATALLRTFFRNSCSLV
ncbi:DUF4149 domain-containing protein [Waterburya agarophytonicola K14]|uniref:DUF4149 domain-containing protein n=1 Tax=Waterburya agarophytonicola KI4 TaxID=2874699 RepID=A0A964BR62_9CYAN|nr:DUF4149 domain-containing protein [Waterburya agarophytonicola]MCC0177023.1 DUF4149 domain-containing protein [Waterburya agarophytonicola KI4]